MQSLLLIPAAKGKAPVSHSKTGFFPPFSPEAPASVHGAVLNSPLEGVEGCKYLSHLMNTPLYPPSRGELSVPQPNAYAR